MDKKTISLAVWNLCPFHYGEKYDSAVECQNCSNYVNLIMFLTREVGMAKKIIKWTDYYGQIRRVQVEQTDDGLYIGHMAEFGAGVSFVKPTKRLIGYFDTKEEAVKYFRRKRYSSIWWKEHPHAKTKTVLVSSGKRIPCDI